MDLCHLWNCRSQGESSHCNLDWMAYVIANATSLRRGLLHDVLCRWTQSRQRSSIWWSWTDDHIFAHIRAPDFIIFREVGHSIVALWAHQPLANRTHAITQAFSFQEVMQINFFSTPSHVSESKTAEARNTDRPNQRRHESCSVPTIQVNTAMQGVERLCNCWAEMAIKRKASRSEKCSQHLSSIQGDWPFHSTQCNSMNAQHYTHACECGRNLQE